MLKSYRSNGIYIENSNYMAIAGVIDPEKLVEIRVTQPLTCRKLLSYFPRMNINMRYEIISHNASAVRIRAGTLHLGDP